ncbi:MAG: hypothetical protein A4E28_00232 [Methanocella sp. PtaU1.Bin125]|nr:MAG: hypothetical protein A4E28_00232 [Methanocella sp. PtaU1.Bin125]
MTWPASVSESAIASWIVQKVSPVSTFRTGGASGIATMVSEING